MPEAQYRVSQLLYYESCLNLAVQWQQSYNIVATALVYFTWW